MIAAECLGQNAGICSQPTIQPWNLGQRLAQFSCYHFLLPNCEHDLSPDTLHRRAVMGNSLHFLQRMLSIQGSKRTRPWIHRER